MPEGKTYFDTRRPLQVNPGLPRDLYPGVIKTQEHLQYYDQPEVFDLIQSDEMPIPATENRENYYDDRHIDYWLSGYVDCRKLEPYLCSINSRARYLDFGGATGRVSRHVTRDPRREVWLCDINVNWIAWIDQFFNRPIQAFQNRIQPALPIEDKYFDLISAFSVFTHLDQDEMPWLLELRRILRPGGHLYLTVLDSATADFKNSAREFLDRADALILHESPGSAMWQAVSLKPVKDRPVFRITPPLYVTPGIAEFVRAALQQLV